METGRWMKHVNQFLFWQGELLQQARLPQTSKTVIKCLVITLSITILKSMVNLRSNFVSGQCIRDEICSIYHIPTVWEVNI